MRRLLSLMLVMLSASVAHAEERTVTFVVENMTCALCPITVRTAMEGVTGVKEVEVDFDSKTAVVVFDDEQATAQDIAEASRQAGYPAAARDAND